MRFDLIKIKCLKIINLKIIKQDFELIDLRLKRDLNKLTKMFY